MEQGNPKDKDKIVMNPIQYYKIYSKCKILI